MKITKGQLRRIIRETTTATEERFIIMKRSRALDDGKATPANAYSHPETTKKADVEPGRIYTSRNDAEVDAQKLGQVNPVGFTVVRLTEAYNDEVKWHQITNSQLRRIIREAIDMQEIPTPDEIEEW